ncbi:D-alanine--D-alanine ligase, partial [bacterium]|nr:D-alanine--D-alanine ligase [bacterium]
MPSTIVIVHNDLPTDAAPDELDVLVQAQSVSSALKDLGYGTAVLPLGLDLGAFVDRLRKLDPVCIFNLVEGLDNDGRLIHVACSLYDHLCIPYTGASTEAMFITSNKVLAKREMLRSGIPTPEWIVPGEEPECPPPF